MSDHGMTAAYIVGLVRRRDTLSAELAEIDGALERLAASARAQPTARRLSAMPATDATEVLGRKPRTCRVCGRQGCDARKHKPGRTTATDEEGGGLDLGRYTNMVHSIAGKIARRMPRHISIDDLVGYGMVGLLEASRRFDARVGVKFGTFAFWRVRGAIVDGVRSSGELSRADIARYRADPSNAIRHVDIDDVAVADATAETPDDLAALGADRSKLKAAIATLPRKERRLIEMHYFEHKTLEEAGATLGLSKSWACRINARAIELMRPMFAAR